MSFIAKMEWAFKEIHVPILAPATDNVMNNEKTPRFLSGFSLIAQKMSSAPFSQKVTKEYRFPSTLSGVVNTFYLCSN